MRVCLSKRTSSRSLYGVAYGEGKGRAVALRSTLCLRKKKRKDIFPEGEAYVKKTARSRQKPSRQAKERSPNLRSKERKLRKEVRREHLFLYGKKNRRNLKGGRGATPQLLSFRDLINAAVSKKTRPFSDRKGEKSRANSSLRLRLTSKKGGHLEGESAYLKRTGGVLPLCGEMPYLEVNPKICENAEKAQTQRSEEGRRITGGRLIQKKTNTMNTPRKKVRRRGSSLAHLKKQEPSSGDGGFRRKFGREEVDIALIVSKPRNSPKKERKT